MEQLKVEIPSEPGSPEKPPLIKILSYSSMLNDIIMIVGKQQFIVGCDEARPAPHVPRFPAAGNSVGPRERDSAGNIEAGAAGGTW